MGRWSRLIAHAFIQWLSPSPALRWLDMAAERVLLSEIILAHASPASVLAVDSSEGFIGFAKRRLADLRITFWIGDALHLPSDAHDMQVAVSGLVLNFIPEPVIALRAICRGDNPMG